MSRRVFLVEQPRRNIDTSGAKIFGEIAYIFGSNCRRHSVMQPNEFMNDVLDALALQNFDPDTDFFCVSGALLPVALTSMAIALQFSRFNILEFNSATNGYEDKTIAA